MWDLIEMDIGMKIPDEICYNVVYKYGGFNISSLMTILEYKRSLKSIWCRPNIMLIESNNFLNN